MAVELDTLHKVVTPENIDLQVECAGPVSRCLAYLIDLGIRALVMLVLGLLALFLDRVGVGLLMLGWFALDWFYPVLFEVLRDGQTPGKRALGLRVVHLDLSPIRWSASLVRNLLRTVDFLPGTYLLATLSMCMTRRFQRLGDLAAGSLVVYHTPLAPTAALPEVRAISAPLALDRDEARALVDFACRANTLSGARQRELAELLAPALPGTVDDPVRYWQGVGLGLMGET
ncbi:RDD family protein [Mangrovimicrobium sediminis]|uniref:RDD family protein n=1 Tax=Mangrovimicrobium sediminis TaxID=2562682 RepID=A0A4Z0M8L7_9GAMM|nr:RDD family protein [Haliea sp. SAOS-164]TGD75824.1 RDD family protein [Haliea sp. SAOS-164]